MELDFLSPVKNTIKGTCSAVSNLCQSASDGLGKMAKNSPNGSVFYGGFNMPFYYGFGFPCGPCAPFSPVGPWGWGGCVPYNNPLVFAPFRSPFLGVYTDPVQSVLSVGGPIQMPTQVASSNPVTLAVAAPAYDPVANLCSPVSTLFSAPENPFGCPIFGATPDALALMGYNVPQQSQQTVMQQGQTAAPQQQPAFGSQVAAPVTSVSTPSVTAPVSGAPTPDLYLHPERYAAQGTTQIQPKAQEKAAITQETKQEVTANNANELCEELPPYYGSLANKKSKGEKLTAQEERLYDNYQKILNEYSPFEKDKDGRIIRDVNGPIRTKLYSKIEELHAVMDSHDNVAAERILRNCSPEELAAIEFYWMSLTGANDEPLNNKPFRTMLKDSYMWRWTAGWLNFNDSDCEALFDHIDEKVGDLSPRSIALSFYQYTNNCHQWGNGIDRTRVINLLNKIKGNQPLIDAVKEEYNKFTGKNDALYSAITGHVFVFQNSDTYKLASDVLHGNMYNNEK